MAPMTVPQFELAQRRGAETEPNEAPHSEAPSGLLERLCSPRVAYRIMVVALLLVMPWAVYRAAGDNSCDFADFVDGGRYVLQHGARHPSTSLSRYLPSLDVACVLLTILPLGVASAIYYLLNVGTWFGLLATIRDRLLEYQDVEWRARGMLAAALLTIAIAADGFLIGAFHVLMVWLTVAGLLDASENRPWKGGTLLGLAVWLKLLPVIGVGYLVLKRRWSAAAVALCVTAALDIVLSLAAFGVQGSWDEHLLWFARGAAGTVDRQMTGEQWVTEDRITNQSLLVVARRLLTERGGFPQLAVADLSPTALTAVATAFTLGLGAVVLWTIRRPAAETSREVLAGEISMVVLATVWISPVVWSYHLSAALPALAVILAHPTREIRKRVVTIAWLIGLALFMVPLARAAGHMLWASLFVGGALLWLPKGPRRRAGKQSIEEAAKRQIPKPHSRALRTERGIHDVGLLR